MYRLLFIGICYFFMEAVTAQIKISPEKPGFTEEVTLLFDATKGNAALEDEQGDIYVHTGILTAASSHPGDWKKVVSDWGENLPKLKMKKVGDHLYEMRFTISELYGIPPAGNVVALNFVFRNEEGTLVGKTSDNGDFLHYLKKPNFKKPPETFATSQTKEPSWAAQANIYEVNVRQYTKEGTFKAFESHLPRLQKMGVKILWFMPVQPIGLVERKGKLGSYYSIQDYTGINPEYGDKDDFKALVDKCHDMGFKVILDWVANHSSRDNVWLEQHPDWYNYDENGEVIAPYDWSDVADLNYDHYYMRKEMEEAMLFWVKEMDIDGFRCDVAGEVPLDFWEDVRPRLDAEKEIWMIAEDTDRTYLLNKAFNANYAWPVHHLMNEIAKGNQPASSIFGAVETFQKANPKGTYPMQFITNHDENSWNGTIEERLGKGHQAFAVLMYTLPGMPLIYSGQEAGLNKRLEFFKRDPIDWSNESFIGFYTALNDLKSNATALGNGNAGGSLENVLIGNGDKVMAFVRKKEDSEVLVLLNLSNTPQKLELGGALVGKKYVEKIDSVLGKKRKAVKGEKLAGMELEAWGFRVFVRD